MGYREGRSVEAAFDQTVGDVARHAGLSPATIRDYCDLGLLPYITTSTGMRLLRQDAGAEARRLKCERLASRGRRRA